MRIVKGVRAMQVLARRCRQSGVRIGFVPTMGCLHAGHLSLVQRARRLVGPEGTVVLSVYVNPTQFGPHEDFERYPRDLAKDARLCREEGVDIVFAPKDGEMYPSVEAAPFSVYVVEEQLSTILEGAARPGHFKGVTTVVAKLFNIVSPDLAVFGQKDFQQSAVVKRMVRDLNFPVKIVVAPTLREPDGLAMSSRNRYLSPAERQQALALWQAIQIARRSVRLGGNGAPVVALRDQLASHIEAHAAARVDYISFFDPTSLQPVEVVKRGTQLALAVFVGQTRLIDNARL